MITKANIPLTEPNLFGGVDVERKIVEDVQGLADFALNTDVGNLANARGGIVAGRPAALPFPVEVAVADFNGPNEHLLVLKDSFIVFHDAFPGVPAQTY